MIYLISIFTILFFILAWWRLDLAVMLLIAAMPAYLIRFNVLGLPSTVLEIMIWAVFLAWFFKSYKDIFRNFKFKIGYLLKIKNLKLKISQRYPFDWEIVLMLFIALVAVGVAGFSASSFGIWKAYFFEPVLLFIVVINVIIKSPSPLFPPEADPPLAEKGANTTPFAPLVKGAEKILWPLAISALIVSALAIYQKFTGAFIDNPIWAAEETRRVVSFFGYPNAVGLYLGPLVLVMTGWLINVISTPRLAGGKSLQSEISKFKGFLAYARNDKVKIAFISLTIVMSALSIYFAKSKGALLGVAAGLVAFGLLANKKIRWATIIIALIFGIGIMAYQPARELAYNTITFKTFSGQIRQAGWSDAWKMIKDGRLITGAGLANFQTAVRPYHTEGMFVKDYSDPDFQRKLVFNEAYRTAHWQPLEIYLYPHNIVLNFWSELGLAGLLLFIWIIGKYFWMGIRVLSLQSHLSGRQGVYSLCHPRASRQQAAKPGDPGVNSKTVSTTRSWIPACAGMTTEKGSFVIADKYLNIGLICAMVVIVVHGLVDAPYFKNDLAVMFWLFIALMGLINLENKYGKNIQ